MSPWGRAGLVTAGVLLVDQATKHLVRSGIARGDEDSVLPGVSLVHVRNEGVAFGAFAGGKTIVGLVVAAAVLALLVYFVRNIDRPLVWLPTGLLIGGAAGNILDRVRDGAVTDFIKLPAWPAFNVADVAITVGVLALLYVVEQGDEEEERGGAAGGG
jgi:signal peptidase II